MKVAVAVAAVRLEPVRPSRMRLGWMPRGRIRLGWMRLGRMRPLPREPLPVPEPPVRSMVSLPIAS